MRQQIDLAILRLSVHQGWLDEILTALQPGLGRIRLQDLRWEALAEYQASESVLGQPVSLKTDVFAQASLPLRRFDACVLPVTLQTLGWTRQALASIPRGPFVPIFGVLGHMRSGAMLDLLELGMADFVCLPICAEEFRARLLSMVARAPRAQSLRETPLGEGRPLYRGPAAIESSEQRKAPAQISAPTRDFPRISQMGWPDLGFGETKQRLIDLFEQQYLNTAMNKARGNVSVAARNSGKDRRAFWELLRKHRLRPADQRCAEEG
jgi:hypothetical protein